MDERANDDLIRSLSREQSMPATSRIEQVLALLSSQPALLSVTIEAAIADHWLEITVHKLAPEQFNWEIDQLRGTSTSHSVRQRRWLCGPRPAATAAASFDAALWSATVALTGRTEQI